MAIDSLGTVASRIAGATPPDRDRGIDALRALAILGVVCGHWLVGALVLDVNGALRVESPLRYLDWLAPASWFLQMLGLFFLVGGYSAALGLRRSRDRGTPDRQWRRTRLARLTNPVVVTLALVGLA